MLPQLESLFPIMSKAGVRLNIHLFNLAFFQLTSRMVEYCFRWLWAPPSGVFAAKSNAS